MLVDEGFRGRHWGTMAAQELAKALERLECHAVRGWKDSGEELLLSFRQAALEG